MQKYISWNVVELPEYACIYVDYDESPTGESSLCQPVFTSGLCFRSHVPNIFSWRRCCRRAALDPRWDMTDQQSKSFAARSIPTPLGNLILYYAEPDTQVDQRALPACYLTQSRGTAPATRRYRVGFCSCVSVLGDLRRAD